MMDAAQGREERRRLETMSQSGPKDLKNPYEYELDYNSEKSSGCPHAKKTQRNEAFP